MEKDCIDVIEIDVKLNGFLSLFETRYNHYEKQLVNGESIEFLVDAYSKFITTQKENETFQKWKNSTAYNEDLIAKLASISAKCVKIVEANRARQLINNNDCHTNYFDNIENCIDTEYENFKITENNVVLLVGSGSYPITLIQIANETGAKVIGIDIDDEAIFLGKKVVDCLAPHKDIEIKKQSIEEVEEINLVTHVIFSSTVSEKYKILQQLYAVTDTELLVSMRYGNDLKSIFNYPKLEIDNTKWKIIEDINRNNQIFDIAIYKKENAAYG